MRVCRNVSKNAQVWGLPNLWLARENALFHVPALPYLGTGKMDPRKIRAMANSFIVS